MDYDSLLAYPRWKMLEFLVKQPSSPLELSHKMRTSVAYISQQLKLLDAVGLVTKERTGLAERGKPRTLFSVSKELAHLSILTKNICAKKLLPLTEHHKTIINIWLIENYILHQPLEKFILTIEEDLDDIDHILIDIQDQPAKVIIVSDSKKITNKLNSFFKENKHILNYSLLTKSNFLKGNYSEFHKIYTNKFLKNERRSD